MIERWKSEDGAALILTVMCLTLILLSIAVLVPQITTTAKQVKTMEENLDARNLAQMGIVYHQRFIQKNIEELERMIRTYKKDAGMLQQEIRMFNLSGPHRDPVHVDADRSFQIISIPSITIDQDRITIEFEIEGRAYQKKAEEIGEIEVNLSN